MVDPPPISHRIRQARKGRGLTIQQLADKLGCSHPNVHQWESGKRNPKLTTLHRIADALEVDLNWLLTGEGAMDKGAHGSQLTADGKGGADGLQLTADGKGGADGSQLTADGKGGLRGDRSEAIRWIPILGVVPGGPPFEPSVVPLGTLPVSVSRVRHLRAFALRVMGYSMIPLINDGDLIACEPYEGEYLAPGTIVIALIQGETTVKSYAHHGTEHLLVAVSGSIKPILLQEGDSILARVVSVHRPSPFK